MWGGPLITCIVLFSQWVGESPIWARVAPAWLLCAIRVGAQHLLVEAQWSSFLPRCLDHTAFSQAHSVCSAVLAPECSFGRLRSMVLPPTCVRLLSRNFSKMHCFRIPETAGPEPGEVGLGWVGCVPWAGVGTGCEVLVHAAGDGEDSLDGSAATGPSRETLAALDSSECLFEPPPHPHLFQPLGFSAASPWPRQADPEDL